MALTAADRGPRIRTGSQQERRASPSEPVKCSGASFECHSARQTSQNPAGGVGGGGGLRPAVCPLWMVGVLDLKCSHPEPPGSKLQRRFFLAINKRCTFGCFTHTHGCAGVSPGATGTPTVSVLRVLSYKAATWQSYSEVSREKLTEASSLTPLVFISSGHSVGSCVKKRDRK